ncbi:exonuclease domain-containing protein [Sphingobacterium sp. MYb388]|uniref:exonuclease domain-containing protein n=1 Tax=Sphingobacterium sp. MYb388 TaxID=2745437 RepID=UPI0030AA1B4F
MEFIAIDFETADYTKYSPCEIGLTYVKDFKIVKQESYLIKPPCYPNFDSFNVQLHGINPDMVKDSPTFDVLYNEKLKDVLTGNLIVSHNTSFDILVLRETLSEYNIEWPELKYLCTLVLSRRLLTSLPSFSLPSVYNILGLGDLKNHHRASADSQAAAEIAIELFNRHAVLQIEDIPTNLNYNIGELSANSFRGFTHKRTYQSSKDRFAFTDLEINEEDFDRDSIFYSKNVVFTGKMTSMTRAEAAQIILKIGGKFSDGLNAKTNILVIGQQEVAVVGAEGRSSKQKKAEDMRAKGLEIEVMSELEFLQNLN